MTTIEQFILDNFCQKTNKQIAQELNIPLHQVRLKAYSLGLYRISLDYWTDEQITFLKENFETIGDTELSQIFQEKFPKNKVWTKKHIDKKRKYLNLHRTPEQILLINKRNIDAGLYQNIDRLSDKYMAYRCSKQDKELRKELLKNKELLEVKRLTIKLKRICRQKSQ
jgi:hypothetical protein